jgi:hypothetical protein
VIYAVDRSTQPTHQEDVNEIAVTAFHLHQSTRVDEFIREAFDRVNLRLMCTLAVDRYLSVDHHVRLPRSMA